MRRFFEHAVSTRLRIYAFGRPDACPNVLLGGRPYDVHIGSSLASAPLDAIEKGEHACNKT
jgi:hypothetical protein